MNSMVLSIVASIVLSILHTREDACLIPRVWCCKAMVEGCRHPLELTSKYMSMLTDNQPTTLWYSTPDVENEVNFCQSLLMEYVTSIHTCITGKGYNTWKYGEIKANNDIYSRCHSQMTSPLMSKRPRTFKVTIHVWQSHFTWVTISYIDQIWLKWLCLSSILVMHVHGGLMIGRPLHVTPSRSAIFREHGVLIVHLGETIPLGFQSC